MEYEEGTILKLKNIKFKGTNKLDFRMNGHPVVVPIYTGYNDDIFYFTSSSKVNHYATEKDRYYLTGNLPKCGLPLTCIIDLKHVYRAVNANFLPKVPLPSQKLKKLINKALDYDSKNLDEDYLELLKSIPFSTYTQIMGSDARLKIDKLKDFISG